MQASTVNSFSLRTSKRFMALMVASVVLPIAAPPALGVTAATTTAQWTVALAVTVLVSVGNGMVVCFGEKPCENGARQA